MHRGSSNHASDVSWQVEQLNVLPLDGWGYIIYLCIDLIQFIQNNKSWQTQVSTCVRKLRRASDYFSMQYQLLFVFGGIPRDFFFM